MMWKSRLVFLVVFLFIIPFRLGAEGQMPASFMFQSKTSSKSDKESNSGSSDILLFNGSYSYSVPLEVPPGINGLQPTLMLTYNSTSGNGWCGQSWDLSFGIIQRSTKNGIPKYDNSDTFMFYSGGSSQELTPIGNNEYRIKIDSSYMKFKHVQVLVGNQNLDYWTAQDKYGNSNLFGLQGPPTNSIVINPNNSMPFSWSLTAIIDKNGNRNDFYYIQDNNQIYLSQCAYSGKTITFQVEDRVDVIINCRSGFPIKTAKRLKSIETKVDLKTIKSYKFSYISDEANKSMLSQIQQYGRDNISSLPPMSFSYTQSECSFGPEISWPAANGALGMIWNIDASYYRKNDFRDINGDGLIDHITEGQVALNNGNGFVSSGPSMWGDIEVGETAYTKINYVDVNGDGLMEAVNKENNGYFVISGSTTTWLAEGDEKSLAYSWLGDIHKNNYDYIIDAKQHTEVGFFDITGDGLPDHVCKTQNENYYSIWVNLLGSFSSVQNWPGEDKDLTYTFIVNTNDGYGSLTNQSYHVEADMVDINGDCLPDHVSKHRDNNYFYVSLNMGDRFGPWEEWPAVGDNYDLRFRYFELFGNLDELRHTEVDFFDINGDGLPDHVWKHRDTSNFVVFLNQGDRFGPAQQWNANGDGLDLKYSFYKNDGNKTYEETEMIDINGDGLPDHVRKAKDSNVCKIRLNQSLRGNLLETIDTGQGGTITVAYDTYIQKDQKLPFSVNVVKSIGSDNGLGYTTTNNYSYSGGLYDHTSKEFLGFAQVTKTDADGNYTTTKFYQNETYDSTSIFPYKGKIKEQAQYDISGNLLAKTVNTYDCVKPVAGKDWYSPRLSQTDNYTKDGGVEKHTWAMYHYDSYGNVTEADNFGDYTTNTDDVIQLTEYAYNAEAYLVGYPVHQVTRDYNSVNKAENWIYYDGAVTENVSPVKGNVTKKAQWLEGGNNTVVTMEYDAYGNVTKVKDANYNADNGKGNSITTVYDTVYHTFPVTITNILGQTSSATYDPGTGNVLTETDINGQTTTHEYDPFGRLLKTYGPIDNYPDAPSIQYAYDDSEFPRKVLIQTKEEGQTYYETAAAKYLSVYKFYDGLGRIAQTQTQTASNWGSTIISDVKTYNSRGLVYESYNPFFPDHQTYPDWIAGQYYSYQANSGATRYTYDALGRVIRQDNPDGSYSTVLFTGWEEERRSSNKDQNNIPYEQVMNYFKDTFGRIVEIREQIPGGPYITKYTYDTLGNLTSITNAINETTTISYDTLSRKTVMDDPKMGRWEYRYDANNNLIWQKDGKGQEINLTYDRLSRIAGKVYPLNSGQISYTYDTGDYGKGRLSQVTDLSGSTSFTYDKLGRVVSTGKGITDGTQTRSYNTGSEYNASGQQTKLTYPESTAIDYRYDSGGSLLKVEDSVTDFIKQIQYNQNKQVIRVDYNNDLSIGYKYDNNNLRLTKLIAGTSYGGGGGGGFIWPDPTFIFPNCKDLDAFNEFLKTLKGVSK